jgi:hypothetical protein
VIVIDVGCMTYGGDNSVDYLLAEYHPRELFGFDPALDADSDTVTDWGCPVELRKAAAWTYDGTIGFNVRGLGGHVDPDSRAVFAAVDLARFIHDLTYDKIILKMDAEGAEYTVLPHLIEQGADLKLELALIEWHCEACGLGGNGRHRDGCSFDRESWWERRRSVELAMRCPCGEWNR